MNTGRIVVVTGAAPVDGAQSGAAEGARLTHLPALPGVDDPHARGFVGRGITRGHDKTP